MTLALILHTILYISILWNAKKGIVKMKFLIVANSCIYYYRKQLAIFQFFSQHFLYPFKRKRFISKRRFRSTRKFLHFPIFLLREIIEY